MSEKARIVVCLPSYNEAGNLPDLIRDTHDAVPEATILVVDDGSSDATGELAREAAKTMPVVVVPHERNMGLAQAIRTAFAHAGQLVRDDGFVIMMDADGTHRPEQIHNMAKKAEAGADLVVAGRYLEGTSVTGVPWHRKVLSAGARFLSRALFGNLVAKDVSCGYRLYTSRLLRCAREAYGDGLIVSPGFSVSLELLVKLVKLGARVDQVPLNLRYDLKKGQSKIRIVRTILQYLKLFSHLLVVRPKVLLSEYETKRAGL
jgi:dolichol-phosphate mannosyltransferase